MLENMGLYGYFRKGLPFSEKSLLYALVCALLNSVDFVKKYPNRISDFAKSFKSKGEDA